MSQPLSKFLNFTSEAAVLVKRGKLSYANASARALLGSDCEGKSVLSVFGPEVAGSQGSSFVASVTLDKRRCTLRMSQTDEGQLFFLSDGADSPIALSDPLLQSLRSSLSNISFAVERLRAQTEKLQSPEITANLDALNHSYYQLLRVTANSSFVHAHAMGHAPFRPERREVAALCASCVDALRHHFPQMEFLLDCRNDPYCDIDPALFKQLLFNLVSNCLIHAQELRHIRIDLSTQGSHVFLSVNDDGCGIPLEELCTVFDRYRHSFDLAQMNKGPGFGLSAACGIAQLHGGTLLLESRPGHGTAVRVSFRLPDDKKRLSLRSQREAELCSTQDVLIGMADCLPDSSFSDSYED